MSRDFAQLAIDLLAFADFACLMLAGYVSTMVYGSLADQASAEGFWNEYTSKTLLVAILGPFALYDRQLKHAAGSMRPGLLVQRTTLYFVRFSGMVLALGFATRSTDILPRALLVMWLGLGFALILTCRLLLVRYIRVLERSGVLSEAVAIVGAGEVADRLIHQLLESRPESIDIVGVFDEREIRGEADTRIANRFGSTGTIADLLSVGKTRQIDWVLVTIPCTAEQRLHTIVHSLKTLAAPIALCPQNVGLTLPYREIGYVGDGVPVTLLADRPIRRWNAVIKEAEDLLLGGLITLLLLPLMAVVALAIRIGSPGPVLFRQRRHGANNDEFDVFKFRTMRWEPEADPAVLKQTAINDDRITPLGRLLRKTSLDELPQLFNVIRGEMSLVGPRPHAVNMRTEQLLGHEIVDAYPHRHRVKPGMTGWAQVNGSRGATETAEQLRRRVGLDLYYVENWSLAFDLKILVLTFWVVIRGTNAI